MILGVCPSPVMLLPPFLVEAIAGPVSRAVRVTGTGDERAGA